MAGSPYKMTLNGRPFGIPADAELKVRKGGRDITEVDAYGDGIHVPIENQVVGMISDIVVRLIEANGDFDDFDTLAKQKDLSIVVYCADGNYSGVGVVVGGTEGIQFNAYRGQSETFSVMATVGGFKKL